MIGDPLVGEVSYPGDHDRAVSLPFGPVNRFLLRMTAVEFAVRGGLDHVMADRRVGVAAFGTRFDVDLCHSAHFPLRVDLLVP